MMSTFEVANLKSPLAAAVDMLERLLGDSGTGTFSLKPDNRPNPAINIPLPSGASLILPPELSVTYKKQGDKVEFHFDHEIQAVWHGFAVRVPSAEIDLSQIHVNLSGIVGMVASITLKAS